MNTRDFFHVALHEARLQNRGWLFRVLVLFSLVFIVGCHVYWQGQGSCHHWRMVAFPCSIPLMNAYLFSLVQGLFLSVMISDFPARLFGRGEMAVLHVRPVSNVVFFWGSLAGTWLLFICLNVVVIVVTVFLVHLTSLAEYTPGYYLFYLLTLNFPSWVVVAGFGVWTSYLTGSRGFSILLSVAWWLGCLFWLPYHFHGTLDYMGSGIPNLFSDLVGHVNPRLYFLQRAGWLLVGLGLLFLCVRRMTRIPNEDSVKRRFGLSGSSLLLVGICSLYLVELDYANVRSMRRELRDSFKRYWSPLTCRVGSHDIRLEQRGGELRSRSDMRVHNPNGERLERLVLFLNPGLRVTGVSGEGEELLFRRDGHVLLVERALEPGDTLSLRVEYTGEVDDACCDLHLPDDEFEDVFHGDLFFPTGRRGAFTGDDFLLLTPASLWYPVAFPPVNPFLPLATARDFTLFHLHVDRSCRGDLFSQGERQESKDGVSFSCLKPLSGISLLGGDLKRFTFGAGDSYNLQFGLTAWGGKFARRFTRLNRERVVAFLNSVEFFYWENLESISGQAWYAPGEPNLYLLETPVSFYLSSHSGKREEGMVEPGVVFFHERGFDMNLVETAKRPRIKNTGELMDACVELYASLWDGGRSISISHPLGLGKRHDRLYWVGGRTVLRESRNRVYSVDDPLMGKMFEYLQDKDKQLPMGLGYRGSSFAFLHELSDHLLGRNVKEVLDDQKLGSEKKDMIFDMKMQDFWLRLEYYIPVRELTSVLDSLSLREGEISYDSIERKWSERWGVDFAGIVREWENATHEQFYRTREMVSYYDGNTGIQLAEGMVLNAGKCGGLVTVVVGKTGHQEKTEFFNCYLAPGEVKRFRVVNQDDGFQVNGEMRYYFEKHIFPLYLGVSANRPREVGFHVVEERDLSYLVGDSGCTWKDVNPEEFRALEPKNEVIVDDSESGFEFVDGNLTWLQRRWLKKPASLDDVQVRVERWMFRFDRFAQGDSIRGHHEIGAGRGKSTATWHVNLMEAGRYRVTAFTEKSSYSAFECPQGIIYYYTVRGGDWEKEVEVPLDLYFPRKWGGRGWIELGEFDFPAGEASVTLSDKEVYGRTEVAIVADAVKWVKLE